MKTQPIEPAQIRYDEGDTLPPGALDCGAHDHPPTDPQQRAQQVYIPGNGLPGRWQRRPQFVVLELGFGLGHNFLATWDAWQHDPQRCTHLTFVAVERHPPLQQDLQRAHRHMPWPALAQQLVQAWPPLTANLHTLEFEHGHVSLLLALGDAATVLPALRLQADAFFLHGLDPAHHPGLWQLHVLKTLGRKAAPGATLATWTTDAALQQSLATAGFVVQPPAATASADHGPGNETRYTRAQHRPHSGGSSASARACAAPQRPPRTAVVVGAGLAGAAVAQALARQGLQVVVLEGGAQPAGGASGNAAGLFHGTVHADDGIHARLHRAAALAATRAYGAALAAGVPGQQAGLLRLELRTGGLALMQQWLQRHRWPANYVQALSAAEASHQAGLPLQAPAWFYPGGGWVSPPAWVQHALATPGVQLRLNQPVAAIQRSAGGWQALGASGAVWAEGDRLVLANARSASLLLQAIGHPPWPLAHTRGQITWRPPEPGLHLQRPLAGDGYVLPWPGLQGGGLPAGWLCGASSEPGEPEGDGLPPVTEADHRYNLQRLHRLTGLHAPAATPPQPLHGRAAWRLNTNDRLPVAGTLPLVDWPAGPRHDQLRLLPREPGLLVLTALGARGLTLAPLLAQLVAAQACGLPWPLEQDLADAVDPARWRVRALRRSA